MMSQLFQRLSYNINMKARYILILIIFFGVIAFLSNYSRKQSPDSTIEKPSQSETSSDNKYCPRNNPYAMNPEFERAVSLLIQRIDENPEAPYVTQEDRNIMKIMLNIKNCLNIHFENIEDKNTEGYFVFDPNSTIDNLNIFVDNRYKNYDDALTALLLSHEITHAAQLVDFKLNNSNLSCIDKEVNAVKIELQFIRFFNDEEKRSLSERVNAEEGRTNSTPTLLTNRIQENRAYSSIKFLFSVNANVGSKCKTSNTSNFEDWLSRDETCHDKVLTEYLKKAIESDKYYMKQCGL